MESIAEQPSGLRGCSEIFNRSGLQLVAEAIRPGASSSF